MIPLKHVKSYHPLPPLKTLKWLLLSPSENLYDLTPNHLSNRILFPSPLFILPTISEFQISTVPAQSLNRHISALGPLHWLFHLTGMFFTLNGLRSFIIIIIILKCLFIHSFLVVPGLSCHPRAQVPQSMWDLISPTRDWTLIPCIGRQNLNHGPQWKSLSDLFLKCHFISEALPDHSFKNYLLFPFCLSLGNTILDKEICL